ncbi:MAG TPA: GAF domain-containing protein [Paludibacter sp.]|nr:GAF domain-containing protein [Paludibacter sp.]
MAEELFVNTNGGKKGMYESLLPQLAALTGGEPDLVANLSNISAALKGVFGWWWVGFYWVKGGELVLGPFQGPVACTRIKFGRGVCGTAWEEARSLLVPDVGKFPGHIACSSLSVSEIVVPVFDSAGQVRGVLDVDSERYGVLDETDVVYLQKIAGLISQLLVEGS